MVTDWFPNNSPINLSVEAWMGGGDLADHGLLVDRINHVL
jgi:hypothetical protein